MSENPFHPQLMLMAYGSWKNRRQYKTNDREINMKRKDNRDLK